MGVAPPLKTPSPNHRAAPGPEGKGKSPSTVLLPHQAWGLEWEGPRPGLGALRGAGSQETQKQEEQLQGPLNGRSTRTHSSLEGFLEELCTREDGAGASEKWEALPGCLTNTLLGHCRGRRTSCPSPHPGPGDPPPGGKHYQPLRWGLQHQAEPLCRLQLVGGPGTCC